MRAKDFGLRHLFLPSAGLLLFVAACTSEGPSVTTPLGDVPVVNLLDEFNNNGACMAADVMAAPAGFDSPSLESGHCSSQDIKIATADILEYSSDNGQTWTQFVPNQQITCNENQPLKVRINAHVKETATSERTDIGIWVGLNGGNGRTGQCGHYNLVNGAPLVGGGVVPNIDGDHCGDMTNAGEVIVELGVIDAVCQSSGTSNLVHIGSCIGWTQPGGDQVCELPPSSGVTGFDAFRWATIPGTSSKCNCSGFDIPILVNRSAKLEIVKACTPSTDPGKFDLLIDGITKADEVGCGGTTGEQTVSAGTSASPGATHTFGEAAGANTSLSNYTSSFQCVNQGGGTHATTGSGTGPISITLQPNEDVICTYTNERKGSITIIKDAAPDHEQDFNFTTTGTGLSSFTLDDDPVSVTPTNTQQFNNVLPGTYTVTEGTDPAGWEFGSLSCTNSGGTTSTSTSAKTATITIGAGGSATCTYVNNRQGSITITKDAQPNDAQDFRFNTTGGGTVPASFFLDDDSDGTLPAFRTFNNVPLGTYTVAEAADPAGWALGSLTCTNSGGTTSTSTAARTATITIGAGGSASCTYVNNGSGSITIVKNAEPNDGRDFQFNTTGGSTVPSSFFLDDDLDNTLQASATFTTVAAGTYTITEAADPTGWQFGSMSCTNSGGTTSTSAVGKVATITLGAGGSATCTYINNKQGSITIEKNAEPNDAQDFQFNTTGGTLPASFFLDDDSEGTLPASRTFDNIPLGAHTVTEAADPTGWEFGSMSCTNSGGTTSTSTSAKTATITIGAGGSATCTYVNNKQGSITITKDAQPNDAQDFRFNTTGGGPVPASFFLDDDLDGALPAFRTFTNVPLGTYTVAEAADPAGWALGGLTCTNSGGSTSTSTAARTATITIGAGGSASCTYVNNGSGSITIVKNAEPNDGRDFQFNTTGGSTVPASFFLDDDSDNTLPASTTFNAVAAGTYTITEAADPTGWQFGSLSCTSSGATTSTSTSTKTATITLGAAGSATCTYVNNKQGSITIIKNAVPNDAQDFQFNTTGGSTVPASFFLDDDSDGTLPASTTFNNVVPGGTYTVTEGADPFNWEFTSLVCVGAGSSTAGKVATIVMPIGGNVTCTYTNTKKDPKLSITKSAVSSTGSPGGTVSFKVRVTADETGGTANDVQLRDTLPAGLHIPGTDPAQLGWREATGGDPGNKCGIALLNDPAPAVTQQSRLLTCNIGTLTPGTFYEVVVEAKVPDNFLLKAPTANVAPLDIDGNLLDADADNAPIDWQTAGISCSAPIKGCAIDQATGASDNSFGNGTKEDDAVPSVVTGSIPNNKSDLLRFYVATQRIVTTDYLYLAWERVQEPSGTTNMDFELNQSPDTSANHVTPVRLAGDLLLKYDLAQGGVNPILGFHRWVTSGACAANGAKPPCWGPGVALNNDVAAAINTEIAVDPIAPNNPRNLSVRTFGEARINLQNSGIFQTGICTIFGSAYLKSRSSDSFTAAIKDFIAPAPINVSNCEQKTLLNTAEARASNFAPPGGALNDWFASNQASIVVSDGTTSGASIRRRR